MNSLKKRFVKDYALPINVFDEPYFSYFLDLYDPLYDCKKKYETFMKLVDNQFIEFISQENRENFFERQSKLIKEISEHILQKEEYQKFNNMNMDKFKPVVSTSQRNVYISDNIGKRLLSIDISKANFNALRFVDPNIVDNTETYEDFIRQFTDEEYIINSKNFRQVIFGQLNVKRQQNVQKYIISLFVEKIIEIVSCERIKSASSDEIVIEVYNDDEILKITNIVTNLIKELQVPINFSVFRIKALSDIDKYGFVKEHENGKVEFKAGNKLFFARAFKEYYGMETNDYDDTFFYEGRLARFL